jgi:hypothetical protein
MHMEVIFWYHDLTEIWEIARGTFAAKLLESLCVHLSSLRGAVVTRDVTTFLTELKIQAQHGAQMSLQER